MFYLTMHSTHFILRLYGVGHMAKNHSYSKRGNLLGYSFRLAVKRYFICTIPHTGRAHTMAFVTPVVEHWLKRILNMEYLLLKYKTKWIPMSDDAFLNMFLSAAKGAVSLASIITDVLVVLATVIQ